MELTGKRIPIVLAVFLVLIAYIALKQHFKVGDDFQNGNDVPMQGDSGSESTFVEQRPYSSHESLNRDAIDAITEKFNVPTTPAGTLVNSNLYRQSTTVAEKKYNPFEEQTEFARTNSQLTIADEKDIHATGGLEADLSLVESLFSIVLEDSVQSDIGLVEIEFTHSPLPGLYHLGFPVMLGTTESVFAHLRIIGGQFCKGCLIKVQHTETQNISLFVTRDLDDEQLVTLYITPQNGWKVGEYYLDVHNPVEENIIMGRNSIVIAEVSHNNHFEMSKSYFIQSLVDSGLATPKIR